MVCGDAPHRQRQWGVPGMRTSPMKRRLLNLLTALSLLLCVAVVALWVRSYWRADVLGYEGPESHDRWQRGGSASSARGLLAVERWRRQNARGGTRPSAGFAFSCWP